MPFCRGRLSEASSRQRQIPPLHPERKPLGRPGTQRRIERRERPGQRRERMKTILPSGSAAMPHELPAQRERLGFRSDGRCPRQQARNRQEDSFFPMISLRQDPTLSRISVPPARIAARKIPRNFLFATRPACVINRAAAPFAANGNRRLAPRPPAPCSRGFCPAAYLTSIRRKREVSTASLSPISRSISA